MLVSLDKLDYNAIIEMYEAKDDYNETLLIETLYEYMVNEDYERVIDFASDFYDTHNVNTFEFKKDCVYELGQYYLGTREAFEAICKPLGIQFGTVGYSPWSYYIALDTLDIGYISDIYEGYNFYDFYIHEDGECEWVGTQYNDNGYIGFEFDFDFDKILNNTDIQYMNVPKELLIEGHYEQVLVLGE